jgi:hypothetical protein
MAAALSGTSAAELIASQGRGGTSTTWSEPCSSGSRGTTVSDSTSLSVTCRPTSTSRCTGWIQLIVATPRQHLDRGGCCGAGKSTCGTSGGSPAVAVAGSASDQPAGRATAVLAADREGSDQRGRRRRGRRVAGAGDTLVP